MPEINIGNRVKMLKDTMQGIVQRVGNDGVIIIETDEGFEIPVLANELVVVSSPTKVENKPKTNQTHNEIGAQGLFLCGAVDANSKVELYLVNREESDKLIALSRKEKETFVNYLSVQLDKNGIYKIPGVFNMDEVESWNKWFAQVICFQAYEEITPPFQAHIQIKSKKLFLAEEQLPLVGGEGLSIKIEPPQKESFIAKPKVVQESVDMEAMQQIDIHAEALGLEANDINLQNLQFEAFLKHFEKCIAYEITTFTVIHGTGKGVMKNRIHKFLSKNEHVKSFKESRKDNFGYGATDVSLS